MRAASRRTVGLDVGFNTSNPRMLQLFVNGPPGSGKTTISRLLGSEFGLEPVATGDLLRDNIAAMTALGREAQQCISAKTLIPDAVVVDMVADKIAACTRQRRGWVLDGFPRTVEQCQSLQTRKQIAPAVVIVLELTESECVKRITGRRFDPETGAIFHSPSQMPRDPDVVARLVKRGDDSPDKLPPRFEAYRTFGEKTNAKFAGIAHRVSASGGPDVVLERISTLLHALVRGGDNGSASQTPPMTFKALHAAAIGREGSNQPTAAVNRSTSALNKHEQYKKHMPQRIEEEDEDNDVESEADHLQDQLQQCKFDYEEAEPVNARRIQPSASTDQPLELSSSSKSVPVESPSPSNNAEHQTSTIVAPPAPRPSIASSVASSPSIRGLSSGSTGFSAADMVKFRAMLVDGFDVLKHGRRGSPHTRTIFTDVDVKRIFWQKPTKDPKNRKAKLDQSLLLADVVQVVRGMKTDVLKRSGNVAKYERYLSLVADDRTLDVEVASEPLCEFLLRGFEQLLHANM